MKLDRENAGLAAAGQPSRQKKFETVKNTLRKQISSVLYRTTSFEEFSDKLMQQYGIAVKESRGQLSYLPTGRTKFIRAKHLGDKFDKAAVLATLQANAERKPKAQFKQDTIGKLIDIQSRMTEGKGIGYKRWLTKHNLKVMAQTVKLLQEKGLTDEDALNQRITELETKYHDSLAVVKDFEGRMKTNKAAQPEKAGSRVCAAGIRKGKVLRAVQRSERRTSQTANGKTECCVLFPGGRTGAAGEIKECAYDQPENRSGVPVPDSPSDR